MPDYLAELHSEDFGQFGTQTASGAALLGVAGAVVGAGGYGLGKFTNLNVGKFTDPKTVATLAGAGVLAAVVHGVVTMGVRWAMGKKRGPIPGETSKKRFIQANFALGTVVGAGVGAFILRSNPKAAAVMAAIHVIGAALIASKNPFLD